MTPSPPADHDRLLELLADRTLVGLDAGEQQELESLLQANPDFDAECLDRTAAMLDRAAAAGDTEPLPEQLQDRIRAGGRLGLQTRPSAGDGSGDPSYENARARADDPARPPHGKRMRRREAFAWLAAAACLSVAVVAWYTRPTPAPPQKPPAVANSEPPATPPAVDTPAPSPATLTVAQQREQLLASAPDVLHVQLVSNDSGAVAIKPGGDIVWSSGRQMGYLRLQGLASNDPAATSVSALDYRVRGLEQRDRQWRPVPCRSEHRRTDSADSGGSFRAAAEDVCRQRGTAGRRQCLDSTVAGQGRRRGALRGPPGKRNASSKE